MNKILAIFFLLPILLTSCNDTPDVTNPDALAILPEKQIVSRGMTVLRQGFSKDNREMDIYLGKNIETESFDYNDRNQVKIKVSEYTTAGLMPVVKGSTPELVSFQNVGVDELRRSGLVVNVIVDLTQPTSVLAQERQYVYRMSKDLAKDNLYLTFMMGNGRMSKSVLATPYVIENYISRSQVQFDESDSIQMPHIYSTVAKSISSMEHNYEQPWNTATYKALVLFTDAIVYDSETNLPIDPEHFQNQLKIIRQARQMPGNLMVSCVSLSPENIDPQAVDLNMLKMLCNRSGGQFYDSFHWENIKDDIRNRFGIRYSDYCITLGLSEQKIFRGNKRYVKIAFTTPKDSLLSQAVVKYSLGSVYNPIYVSKNGETMLYNSLIKGLFQSLFILLLVYLVMQIGLPLILYKLFRKKYVTKYFGENMVFNKVSVPKTCYYCKAPFAIGDSIVARCMHVVHEECWKENDYRCPEHGTNCHEGSHYYNQQNLFDPKNASFYMKWVVMSIAVALVTWLLFLTVTASGVYSVIEWFTCFFFGIDNPNAACADYSEMHNLPLLTSKMYYLPVAALYLCFSLTAVLATVFSHHSKLHIRIFGIILRTLAASVVSFVTYMIFNYFIVLWQLYDELSYLIDWIPWTITALTVVFCSAYQSRIRIHQKYLLVAIVGSLISIFFWELSVYLESVDDDLLLIISMVIFAIAVTLTVARDMPSHEHYFLHVSGEVKEMDIAMYKWLRTAPESVVYIGRSVDCHLQITWDSQSNLAPVHAAISHNHGAPVLTMVDGTVYLNNVELQPDKEYRLYHGDTFMIGTTRFRFHDK